MTQQPSEGFIAISTPSGKYEWTLFPIGRGPPGGRKETLFRGKFTHVYVAGQNRRSLIAKLQGFSLSLSLGTLGNWKVSGRLRRSTWWVAFLAIVRMRMKFQMDPGMLFLLSVLGLNGSLHLKYELYAVVERSYEKFSVLSFKKMFWTLPPANEDFQYLISSFENASNYFTIQK